jgi:hypothetical protein
MRRALVFGLAVSLALGGCGKKPRTEIVVTVDSNLSVPAELDQVQIVVTSEKSSMRFDQTYDLGPSKTKLPIVVGLVPDADKKVAFRVVATGRSKGHPFQGDFLEDFGDLSSRAVETCARATRPGA